MHVVSRHTGATASAAPLHIPARARVLFLTCHLPWPAISGGRRRELELIRRLAPDYEIHLIAVSKTPDQDRRNADRLLRWCESVEVLEAQPSEDSNDAPQVARHHCPEASRRVREILAAGAADLIHIEGFYLMQHVPPDTEAPVLLVEQNVEYELALQRHRLSPDPRLAAEAELTASAERACWAAATGIAAVTAEDARIIRSQLPGVRVCVIPDGADHVRTLRPLDGEVSIEHPGKPLMVLVANFAYAPNVDAARHFVVDIMPTISQSIPDANLWLVGNEPPRELRELSGDHVHVTGRVPDVVPYLDVADVFVCPLRVGGGVKVKTIEAMRRGKAIVATSIGAQGLPHDALAIADDPVGFAGAVVRLLRDGAARRDLGRRAAHEAHQLARWDDTALVLAHTYDDLLRRVRR